MKQDVTRGNAILAQAKMRQISVHSGCPDELCVLTIPICAFKSVARYSHCNSASLVDSVGRYRARDHDQTHGCGRQENIARCEQWATFQSRLPARRNNRAAVSGNNPTQLLASLHVILREPGGSAVIVVRESCSRVMGAWSRGLV